MSSRDHHSYRQHGGGSRSASSRRSDSDSNRDRRHSREGGERYSSSSSSSRKRPAPRGGSGAVAKSPRRSHHSQHSQHSQQQPRHRGRRGSSGSSRPPETSAKRETQKRHLQKQNRENRKEKCADFLTTLVFENKLPAVPFPPKFVANQAVPGGVSGLATYFLPELDYQRSSLEESKYQFPLLCGVDVGCPLDFIDVSALRVPRRRPGEPAPALHPDDAELLHDEQDALAAMRADLLKQHWVQKEMISENTVHSDHHHVSQVEREEKQLKRAKAEEQRLLDQFQDGRSMAERIEDGFRFANAPELPPHPTKGDSVKPVRSWPLVPHDELHGRKYGTMHFDHDFAKKVAMPFPEAADYGFLLQEQLSKQQKKRRKSSGAAAELLGTFYVPETREDEADATVADQGMRLQTVETVKIAIHATEADAARPFLVWWDPEADILKYSAAQTSIILSKAPATVSDTANVRERYTVLRPGQRRGAAGTVIASATTSPAQPSSAGRSTDRTATGRTQGGSSSDESSDSD
eukprot:INCI18212.1.p1 GENE.INCI18212.1~~INCI18212.1.p1  ORF type:complete len:521 (-),score=102.83 INCI18212.1:410-1972(-)